MGILMLLGLLMLQALQTAAVTGRNSGAVRCAHTLFNSHVRPVAGSPSYTALTTQVDPSSRLPSVD